MGIEDCGYDDGGHKRRKTEPEGPEVEDIAHMAEHEDNHPYVEDEVSLEYQQDVAQPVADGDEEDHIRVL